MPQLYIDQYKCFELINAPVSFLSQPQVKHTVWSRDVNVSGGCAIPMFAICDKWPFQKSDGIYVNLGLVFEPFCHC